jgi:hypothetical protein
LNPDTTLLLVGAADEAVQKARRLGLHVLLPQHPGKPSDEQERLADRTRVLDHTDRAEVRPVAEELKASPGYGAALSLTEAGLENAGRINELFGLGGTGFEVAHRIRDKVAMRLHPAGLDPAAPAAALLLEREDLDVFAGRHGHGEAGRVESVSGVEEVRDRLDVRLGAGPGDTVRERKDHRDRLGLVAVTGPHPTSAIPRGAEPIRDTLEIRTARTDGGGARARVAGREALTQDTGVAV